MIAPLDFYSMNIEKYFTQEGKRRSQNPVGFNKIHKFQEANVRK
jgi:hypothetical protein